MFFFQLINFKMSERRSLGSWGNLQSSVNFNGNLFESSSRFGWKHYDESISQGFKFGVDHQEDSCNGYHPFANENTINFSDITDRKFIQNSQYMPLRPTNFNQTKLTDIFNWAPTPNTKKGLKQFASLLLKIIIRRRFTSHQEITGEIEKLLVNRNGQQRVYSKEERLQQKNIKRRIYDALNVMMSAGILSRQIYPIQQNNQHHLLYKNYSITNKKNQLQNNYNELNSRITRKKQLIAKLQYQFEALKKCYQQKSQKTGQNPEKLYFPLIILVRKKRSRVAIEMQQQRITVCHKNVSIYSQTDLIEQATRIEWGEKDNGELKLQFEENMVQMQ